MADHRFFGILLCLFSCLYSGLSQLNLSEGSRCINKIHNGTCVRLFRCGSAVLTYLYRNAGFLEENQLPEIPEICSNTNNEPVVCCTDCLFSERDEFRHSAISPNGVLVSRRGRVAWKKCLDYFQRLPYPCRGKGNIELRKSWNMDAQCHDVTLRVAVNIGGQDPHPWKFPHLALLGYGDPDSVQWLCEGTIISERFILTAAHCTNGGVFGNAAFVAVGTQKHVDREKHWKIYNVKRIIKHPEYNEPSWYHDLALLETESEIRFDEEILPACLDVGIRDASVAETAGTYGPTENQTQTRRTGDDLQMIYVDRLQWVDCAFAYKPSNSLMKGYDHKIQTCYGTHSQMDDTCKRLSGSPLQVDQFHCQYSVVGVTSHVKDCGEPNTPDLYTRVLPYLPWIERIVWPED
ncbi:serine protease snake-like isoform X2 [Trichoplusia ni]|uniref:Serine protease snake-like isoform X2 n=1 Tax=Trichoplusia ni TaxID=7111 RepID=A0A7E5VQR0_TRINI|nr:serine protease snake-like isoform X2 [Trichoplusia ni]